MCCFIPYHSKAVSWRTNLALAWCFKGIDKWNMIRIYNIDFVYFREIREQVNNQCAPFALYHDTFHDMFHSFMVDFIKLK